MIEHVMNYVKTGLPPVFTDLKEAQEYIDFATSKLLTGSGDELRERVTIEMVNGQHSSDKHGWDGHKGKLNIEVKNETEKPKGGFTGSGIFNNLTWSSFEKYQQGGLYLHGGYDREGVLSFVVAFDIGHLLPKMKEALMKKLPNGDEQGKNVTVNIKGSDFPALVEVVYENPYMKRNCYTRYLNKIIADSQYENYSVHGKKRLTAKK